MSDYSTTQPSVQSDLEAEVSPARRINILAIISPSLVALSILSGSLSSVEQLQSLSGFLFGASFLSNVGAVATGHVALSQIKRGRGSGRGWALGGLITGYVLLALAVIGVLAVVVLLLFFVSMFSGHSGIWG